MSVVAFPSHLRMSEARWEKRTRYLHGGGGLRIHEIYRSVQGESTHVGRPCTFVRTTACHLRCGYCDTPHAFAQGSWMSAEDIIEQVERLDIPLVEFTGGEPLLQPGILPLMNTLCDRGFELLLETSGSLSIADVDERVCVILDLKCPTSGEAGENFWGNVEHLKPHHELKFVIGGREDFDWALERCTEYALFERATVLMGVVFEALDPKDLIDWILDSGRAIRFQSQMHKSIWPPDARGV